MKPRARTVAVWFLLLVSLAAQKLEGVTLQDALDRHLVTLEEATPTGGYSRFKISLKNPTREMLEIDPYGAAFEPPSTETSQRVGLGLPLNINNRQINLRRSGMSSEPTDTIPPLNEDDSSAARAAGALAAGALTLLGILALGQMGGQSWGQDLSDFQNLLSGLKQAPPPVDDPTLPQMPQPPAPADWPPAAGAINNDGKVWCQPPWDQGGPYWMDPNEYHQMKSQQAAGKIWDDRNGWVSRDEQSQYVAQQEASRLASEADSRALAAQYADNERMMQALAAQEHQRDIANAAQKAQDEGLTNLSAEDRDILSQADENTKALLRGDPVTIHGYEKRVAEYLMSQGAIDNTAYALGWAKDGVDQAMNLAGAYAGPPGKVVSIPYAMLSNTLGSVSEGIAQYNSGLSNAKTLGDAAAAGAKKGAYEGVKAVVTDEVVGAATKPLSAWLGNKGKDLLNQSTSLKLALYDNAMKQGLSGGFLKNAMANELGAIHNHIEKTTEWAVSETAKWIGKKTL